ncbi:substrate-binding domain-containing protein [Vibrio sp. SCSIO 43132]|uniref:substrate-binding domain-containing protein n=1 Tax=Vibrio sp. SCSIO 43132 TaxID=2779363 RepID=UPI001CA9D2AD|nr:substrate-binding domain-containing protein [Vibrio sp. SCSIO 43132]UAB71026.1 substrate-binding domain-containing protein [Vibrio sp. SCSIO 43132]
MATIKDIMRLVGVSSATVSRVLSGDESFSISEEKRLSIINAARQLGYKTPRQRNVKLNNSLSLLSENKNIAGSLSQKSLTIINYLSQDDEISDPYYTSIRMGIEQACMKHFVSLRNAFRGNNSVDANVVTGSDGVIAVGPIPLDEINEVRKVNENIVLIDPVTNDSQIDVITFDKAAALRELFTNIINSGAKDIALTDLNDDKLQIGVKSVEGFNDGINSHFEQINHLSIQEGYDAAFRILEATKKPDVILAANDIVAIGILRALHEKGVQVPEEVGVVGINDIDVAKVQSPPLSTLKLYPEEMGQAAISLLFERMEGRKIEKTVIVGYRFIQRESLKSVE